MTEPRSAEELIREQAIAECIAAARAWALDLFIDPKGREAMADLVASWIAETVKP